MIVVIGAVELERSAAGVRAAGMAAAIARAAAAAGADVEVIAKVGDDAAGDALLIALAGDGIGHVAVLRDAAHATAIRDAAAVDELIDDPTASATAALLASASPIDDASPECPSGVAAAGETPTLDGADVELGMRYVTDFGVIVAVEAAPEVAAAAVAAATWGTAHLVAIVERSMADPGAWPRDALVVEVAHGDDGSGGLADRLGRYAAAVDGGRSGAEAYALLVELPAG